MREYLSNGLLCAVSIEASKDGVRFSCQGDIGSGSVTVRQHSNVDKPDQDVSIQLVEPVSLTFSLKYLVNFCKASGLASKVKLCLSQEVPLLVEYGLSGSSHLRFYLAPKVRLDTRFKSCLHARLTNAFRSAMMNKRSASDTSDTSMDMDFARPARRVMELKITQRRCNNRTA